MEQVSIVLTKSQVVRLRLLVEYEIKRDEVLMSFACSPAHVDHCYFEIEKFNEILDKLKL